MLPPTGQRRKLWVATATERRERDSCRLAQGGRTGKWELRNVMWGRAWSVQAVVCSRNAAPFTPASMAPRRSTRTEVYRNVLADVK